MAKQKVQEILIDQEWCKGCKICVHFCPKNVLDVNKAGKAFVANLNDCTGCKLCEQRCPDLAIEIKFDN
jgi:2-oxoglutarate ferredoxin oxidoreductase subunit delta